MNRSEQLTRWELIELDRCARPGRSRRRRCQRARAWIRFVVRHLVWLLWRSLL